MVDETETKPATEEKKEEEKKKWELSQEDWEILNKRLADLEAEKTSQEATDPESETDEGPTLEAKTLTVSAPPEESESTEEHNAKPARKSNKGKRAKQLNLRRRKF